MKTPLSSVKKPELKNPIQSLILQTVRSNLNIITDIAHPDVLIVENSVKNRGYEIFNQLIPYLDEKIAKIIFDSTFGQIDGTLFTQAFKIKTKMSKKYAHLEQMLGESRFKRVVDFPQKLRKWKQKGLKKDEINQRFVSSLVRLFFSSARRDPDVFTKDLLPVMREELKSFILKNFPHVSDINSLVLDAMARDVYKKLDLSHARMHTKDLIKDIQTYCSIIYFINHFEEFDIVFGKASIVPILRVIRSEIKQICEELRNLSDFKSSVIKQMKFLGA